MTLFTPLRLFVLAALLPTVGFATAVAMIYRQPLPDWALPPPAEVPVALPDPTYLELDEPVQVGLYGGRIQISLNLAFAARLDGPSLLELSGTVKERQSAIMAQLTAAILKEGEQIDSSKGLAMILRQSLPAILRDEANAALSTDSIPNPVDEVLILDLTIQPG